jgi:hypothetical protein
MTNKQIPRKFGITIAIALLLTTSTFLIGQTPHANALAHSSNVAYVFDFGTGISDTSGPGSGSSILVNAINGVAIPSGGTYTTASGTIVTITDVPVSTVDAGGLGAISGFDTVIVYQVCDIASHPATMTALNSYLTAGDGKVVIFDGDRCSPIAAGSADYSTFLFPFMSSNPGPLGAGGTINTVEVESPPATLTSGIATGFYGFPIDAVGDSNTFTSNTGGWCAAIIGTNGEAPTPATGIQVGYARTLNGGLAIYDGQDNWFTFGSTSYNKSVFDNILDQPFNPDKLPCGLPVTGIKLDPATASNPAGTSHTVTATLTDINTGKPMVGVTVTFTVTSGPNAGKTGTAVTDASGVASFTYTDTGGAGTDTIVATFLDAAGGTHTSNTVNKIWTLTPTKTVTASSQTSSVIPTTSVTDTATVTGSGASSSPDLTGTISFQLCGPNPTASTSANCAAAGTVPITTPNGGTFTATSPAQSPTAGGSYCWTATYNPDATTAYSGSGSTTVDKECFSVLASVTTGKMTGGGSVIDPTGTPNTRVTHGIELQCDVTKTPNNLQINWGSGNKFHLDSLTSAFCVDDPSITPNPPAAGFDTYVGTGTGSFNGVSGYQAQWTFTDAGEPGTSDHAKIVIKNSAGTIVVLSVSGNLDKGNQQAHK